MIDLYPTRINLPPTNHYGLPYTKEEREAHELLMPPIPPRSINPVVEFILEQGTFETLFLPEPQTLLDYANLMAEHVY